MTRFQFVADHSDAYQVKRLCELVELERSSYYAWKAAEPDRLLALRPTRSWPNGSG